MIHHLLCHPLYPIVLSPSYAPMVKNEYYNILNKNGNNFVNTSNNLVLKYEST